MTGESGSASRPLTSEGVLVVMTALGVPVLLYVAHLAPYGRLLYPATNLVLAGYLFARRSPWYAGHCLLIFCCVSLVRRLVDEQGGWDPSSVVLLTPYLCCLLTVISFGEYWSRREPRSLGPFLVIAFCVAYGTALAMLNDRFFASIIDAMKWMVGPLFAVYVLANRERLAEIRGVVEPCLVWAGTAMAAYGVVQYFDPQPWDAEWMRNVAQLGFDSIGQPEPFAVRVFSTMNSPGSLGVILSAAIVVALKRRPAILAPTLTLMTVGLALCQYRALWAATVFALILVFCSRGAALKASQGLTLLAVGLVLCSTAAVPRVRETIVERAKTLVTLKGDESLESRQQQYAALARADDLIFGEGLAISGTQRRLDNDPPVAIDGALIEILRGMGVIVGGAFLLALSVLFSSLVFPDLSAGRHIFFDRAIVAAIFVQLPMGSVHTGELGFCAWMFLGFALAQGKSASACSASYAARPC